MLSACFNIFSFFDDLSFFKSVKSSLPIRFSTSIVASYEKLYSLNPGEAEILTRFLNFSDNPFKVTYGAIAVHSNDSYDLETIKQVITEKHRDSEKIQMIVIHSEKLMDFINKLYLKASEV